MILDDTKLLIEKTLNRELQKLQKQHMRAAKEADERLNIYNKQLEITREFLKVSDSTKAPEEKLKIFDELKVLSEKAKKISKKDYKKLLDKQYDLEDQCIHLKVAIDRIMCIV